MASGIDLAELGRLLQAQQQGAPVDPRAQALAEAFSMVSPGNIDIGRRPVVKNPDGSISTVRSMSINVDGNEVLIPTVSEDGRVMSDDEAIRQFQQTGRNLGRFRNVQGATNYAERLHEQQAKQYGP